jgi:hypothetical protein
MRPPGDRRETAQQPAAAGLAAEQAAPPSDPVVHWTPEEPFYAECGGGKDGDFGILNSEKVTCPECRARAVDLEAGS